MNLTVPNAGVSKLDGSVSKEVYRCNLKNPLLRGEAPERS